jgi:hypothetical protein
MTPVLKGLPCLAYDDHATGTHASTSSSGGGGVFGGAPVYSTSGDFQHYAIAQLEVLIHEVQRETLILEM